LVRTVLLLQVVLGRAAVKAGASVLPKPIESVHSRFLTEPRAERVKQRKRDSRSGQKHFAAMDFVTYAATAHAYTRLVA
jgi:hypothetical protein